MEPRRTIRSKPPETPPQLVNHRGEPVESVPIYDPMVYGSGAFYRGATGSLHFARSASGHYPPSIYEFVPTVSAYPHRATQKVPLITDPEGRPVRSERVVQIPVRPTRSDPDAVSGAEGGAGDGTAVTKKLGQ